MRTTPLPEITGGDFDHFAVDLRHKQLYVVSEVYASIEVFRLETGEHLQSVRGIVRSPREIVFLEDTDQLVVADAGSASYKFLDAADLHVVHSVSLEPGTRCRRILAENTDLLCRQWGPCIERSLFLRESNLG
jgi:hypothetical protein